MIAEFLRGSAMVIKRSSVSGEWDGAFVLTAVQDLLQNQDERLVRASKPLCGSKLRDFRDRLP